MSLEQGSNPNFEVAASLLDKWEPQWKPLKNRPDGEEVLIWNYNGKEANAVVYRFVIEKDNKKFTIYVGSGEKLSGSKNQYKNPDGRKKRKEIRIEIKKLEKLGWKTWTEVIELDEGYRFPLEHLAISKYWLEYLKKSQNNPNVPRFLNRA